MNRIIGGIWGGRRIAVPAGRDTRPTSDRAREALFNTLAGLLDLHGAQVLDLYAGSGAVGLESLSRGAAGATLVERNASAAAVIAANIATLQASAQLLTQPVRKVLADAHGAAPRGYDLVFADPPYPLPDSEVDEMLTALCSGGWLAWRAVVVVERPGRGNGPSWPPALTAIADRRYGEARFWYGRRS